MKRHSLAFFLLLFSVLVKAQPISPYIDIDNTDSSIVLKAKSTLYTPDKDLANELLQRIDAHFYYDYIVPTSSLKTKKVAKQTEVPVLGFIRSKDDFLFDSYVVLYKDKVYFASPSDVIDNGLLKQKTKSMTTLYNSLKQDVEDHQKKFNDCCNRKGKEITDTLANLNLDSEEWQSVITAYHQSQIEQKEQELKQTYNNWVSTVPISARKAANLLSIEASYLDKPNSASGCDYILHYTNRSNKTIKYLHWYGNIYNAVNDRVSCDIRRTINFSGYDTGPVLPNQHGGGLWETVIYRWDAKEMRLTKIKIDYTDGTSAIITANDIPYLRNVPSATLSQAEIDKIQKWIPDTISTVFNTKREKYSKRKYYIEKIKDNPLKTPLVEGLDDEDALAFFEDLNEARAELIKSKQALCDFENDNHIFTIIGKWQVSSGTAIDKAFNVTDLKSRSGYKEYKIDGTIVDTSFSDGKVHYGTYSYNHKTGTLTYKYDRDKKNSTEEITVISPKEIEVNRHYDYSGLSVTERWLKLND